MPNCTKSILELCTPLSVTPWVHHDLCWSSGSLQGYTERCGLVGWSLNVASVTSVTMAPEIFRALRGRYVVVARRAGHDRRGARIGCMLRDPRDFGEPLRHVTPMKRPHANGLTYCVATMYLRTFAYSRGGKKQTPGRTNRLRLSA